MREGLGQGLTQLFGMHSPWSAGSVKKTLVQILRGIALDMLTKIATGTTLKEPG